MSNQRIGYIRVSSSDQNPERQLADISLDRKFVDAVSGGSLTRPALEECINYVREGDELYIDSIDRLARNLRHLQDIIDRVLRKNVSIKFMKEQLTFSAMNDPLANLTLQMMGAFAEFERTMIKSRQKEGIELARRKGKHLGRPPIVTKEIKEKALKLLKEGNSISKISKLLCLSRASIYKALGMKTILEIKLNALDFNQKDLNK